MPGSLLCPISSDMHPVLVINFLHHFPTAWSEKRMPTTYQTLKSVSALFTSMILCLICCSAERAHSKPLSGSADAKNAGRQNDGATKEQTSEDVEPNEGDRALDLGQYGQAETYFINALKQSLKKDVKRAYLQTGLAEAILNQGRFQEAAREYKKAQALVESDSSSNALKARLYDGLSWLYHAQGKLAAAG